MLKTLNMRENTKQKKEKKKLLIDVGMDTL